MRHILIAQPTAGTVLPGTVGHLMALGQALSADGTPWSYRHLSISDISLARSIFASHVIADNLYSHVLFIDSDMGFAADTIRRMIAFDKPLVAAACPKRYLAWDTLHAMATAEADLPAEARRSTADLMAAALEYNVQTTRCDGSPFTPRRQGQFMTVPAIGTGIMLIHRDVFEIMLAREAARPRPGYRDLPLLGAAPLCDFFSHLASPDGRIIESEDISFCWRWAEMCGGEIWADIESPIQHFGMRDHTGRYAARAPQDFPSLAKDDR